ncbi:hypothetical protein [Lactiplantibacillus paraxiangfangensis]|uniref:hypothetical protein n=1 Tax=Lactiplantibacillus paraxiangfangensis TaxID=3076224 RepID=UPI0030C73113
MTINVGDRVAFDAVKRAGELIVPGGTGKVVDVKMDPFSRAQVATVVSRRHKFQIMTKGLKVVGRKNGRI